MRNMMMMQQQMAMSRMPRGVMPNQMGGAAGRMLGGAMGAANRSVKGKGKGKGGENSPPRANVPDEDDDGVFPTQTPFHC